MDMKVVHKEAFQVIGFSAHIPPEEGYIKCPEFWEKEFTQKYARLWNGGALESPQEKAVLENHIGTFSVCIEPDEYMIAGEYLGGKVPEGMKLYGFPESDWIYFSGKGALPKSLQELDERVYSEWYPDKDKDYLPIGCATIEYYSAGNPASEDYECGIRIPVISKMIAPCGLDCRKCDAYIATVNNDNALREKTAKHWAELNSAPITPEMINCLGCRGDGVKTPFCGFMCEIRKCSEKEKRDFCAKCKNAENCEKLDSILENSEEARENFEKLR